MQEVTVVLKEATVAKFVLHTFVHEHVVLAEEFGAEVFHFRFDTPGFALFNAGAHEVFDPVFKVGLGANALHDPADCLGEDEGTVELNVVGGEDAQFAGECFDDSLEEAVDGGDGKAPVVVEEQSAQEGGAVAQAVRVHAKRLAEFDAVVAGLPLGKSVEFVDDA